MGQKVWISDRKKVSEIRTFVFGFRTLFYLHTSDNLLPFTYSVRLNVGVSNKTKKACCKPFRSQWYALERSNFRHWNPNMLKSERFVCVPKIPNVQNLNVLKSELAFVQISALSEIRTFGFQTFIVCSCF